MVRIHPPQLKSERRSSSEGILTNMDTNKVALGLKIFGATLFAVCLGLFIWSLTRPPVTTGPMPPAPWDDNGTMQQKH